MATNKIVNKPMLQYFLGKVKSLIDLKVDKVTGKGLSTNDYTTAEKEKLAGVATGATNVTIDNTISIAGQAADAGAVGTALSGKINDVQVNSTSVVSNGVANIPIADADTFGVVKADVYTDNYGGGVALYNDTLVVVGASNNRIKTGKDLTRPIATANQHVATFYGLAKAAGDSTQSVSDNAVGTYTNEAKTAIKSMIGVTVDDVQVDGTSILNNGIANVPFSTTSRLGAVQIGSGFSSPGNGILNVDIATAENVKAGSSQYKTIGPYQQHRSVFYGLAKAAGDATQSASSNAVGTYTDDALKAIRKMLGIPNIKWELIQDYTTTEDLETVTIDTDSNGQSFKLTSVLMLCKTSASTTGTADYMTAQYVGDIPAGTASTGSFPTFKMQTASRSLFKYIGEILPGIGFVQTWGAVSSDYGYSSSNVLTMTHNVTYEYIKQLKFRQYNATSSLVPSGTNIKIYGIRYDE